MKEKTIFGISTDDLDLVVDKSRLTWDELRDANIFLTGGTGFLGRWMLAGLVHANRRFDLNIVVTVLTRDPIKLNTMISDIKGAPSIKAIIGDIRDFSDTSTGYSHIIHAATDTSTSAESDPIQLMDCIIDGTRRVLDLASAQEKKCRVLYLSSGAIYGAPKIETTHFKENHAGTPPVGLEGGIYPHAKRIAELQCMLYSKHRGVDVSIARCFTFVGPLFPIDAHFAIGNFIRDALAGTAISVSGNGSPVRSYLYAADATAWLLTILCQGNAGESYNVGSNAEISILGLAEFVRDILAPDVDVNVAHNEPERGLRSYYVPDISKAQTELSLDVWTNMSEALRRTRRWAERSFDFKNGTIKKIAK